MTRMLLAAASLLAVTMVAPAVADTLTTGSNDGQITLDVDAFGGLVNTGLFNPVGPTGPGLTIASSDIFFRLGTTGMRGTFAQQGTQVSFTGNDTTRVSVFTLGDPATGGDAVLGVALTQTVSNLLDGNGTQTGSMLTQSYALTNLGTDALVLDLVRFLDGDLQFDGGGSFKDGGGVRTPNGTRVLFDLDSANDAAMDANFLALFNSGDGTETGFQVRDFATAQSPLFDGDPLTNMVDNDTDNDGFADASFDVTLGLGSVLNIAGGGSQTFTTSTIFSSGVPARLTVPGPGNGTVPEPATWATFILGFGLLGGAMRRRTRAAVRLA